MSKSHSEQIVEMGEKIYKCRSHCILLFGSEWKKRIETHTNLIKSEMMKSNISNEVEAAINLIDDYNQKYPESSEAFTIKILAAAVELIEPSK